MTKEAQKFLAILTAETLDINNLMMGTSTPLVISYAFLRKTVHF
jgi:hypothetical protein